MVHMRNVVSPSPSLMGQRAVRHVYGVAGRGGGSRTTVASSNATIRMRGFGSFEAAARFCPAHDELRDHLRYRQHLNETVSLADQRHLFQERWGEVCALLQAA
jgi:hypothetical protein